MGKFRRNFNVYNEFVSLLPKVYNVDIPDWGPCSVMALEVIRLAAVIVTVLHLLALAVNHYIGIARPLHYAGNIIPSFKFFQIFKLRSMKTILFVC